MKCLKITVLLGGLLFASLLNQNLLNATTAQYLEISVDEKKGVPFALDDLGATAAAPSALDTSDTGSNGLTIELPTQGRDRSRRDVNTRFITFELGFDIWLPAEEYRLDDIGGDLDPFEQRLANSTNVNLYIMRQRFNLVNHHLNLEYGIGLNFHKIMFDNPIVMRRELGVLSFDYEGDAERVPVKTRLNSTYLTIPLLLNYESNPSNSRNSFRIAAGVYGNTRLGSNFKQKFNNRRRDNIKEKDNFNLSPFRWGVAGQIGYGPVNFYINYSMTDVFDKNKNSGYEIGMVSAGLILIPF